MSLAINTTTSEGMVLAADTRQSYRNSKGMVRIGSESVSKLLQISSRVGIAFTGLAFLLENDTPKNVSKFIDEFKRETDVENLDVATIAKRLHEFFNTKYQWQNQLNLLPAKIQADLARQGCEVLEIVKEVHSVRFRFKDPQGIIKLGTASVDMINFLISGFNPDGSHAVHVVYVPGEVVKKLDSKEKFMEYGATWIGQIDVVSRIVLGFDGRIGNLEFVQKAEKEKGFEELNKQLRNLEYIIQWGTMALQDAVDFCTLIIKTTSAIQRFSDGIKGDPGDMPGVGENVEVAVITPHEGLRWVNKRQITSSEKP
jgi:20S proteasome alpha/beta subunit